MKPNKIFIKAFFLIVFSCFLSNGQKAQSLYAFNIEADEDTINIAYNLVGQRPDDVYKVDIFVSGNNGQAFDIIPTTIVGDVGYGVKSGVKKKMQWQPLEDSVQLIGDDYIFKISARLLGGRDSIEFAEIPGGTFIMGNNFEEGRSDENYPHKVNLDPFLIGVYEITNIQFSNFLYRYESAEVKSGEYVGQPMIFEHEKGLKNYTRKAGQSGGWAPQKGYEYHPVVNVTWYGANEFCKYYGYRLPTEAEWEYAARELGDTIRFGNGKNLASPTEINFNGHIDYKTKYSKAGENRQYATRIASFPPNKLELFDMSGNVWEWCQDWYASNYYFNSITDNPTGPWFGETKSIRGGSWHNTPVDIRVTDRSFLPPHMGSGDVGFRVVKQLVK
ncbi:MAG: SUMF1/EgtB/PvdO family nonheme iron enzyme [Ignavibacteriae bacterium]|nr:hypothetical protein [Ignavibacteriota bacterium]NOG99542.1 SUMF1/EgtB/PvdO family nonheme iron enzyme [Ignavibacteriota bacterium]